MLHREDGDGYIAVAQPAHAWVAGQLARQWGNATFGAVEPREAVCLAATRHDDSWTAWEQAPTLNLATGRPHTFMSLPTGEHVRLWAGVGAKMEPQGRYAALLVALHGWGLYQTHDYARDTPQEAEAARRFVADTRAWIDETLAALQRDPATAPYAAPEVIERNRRLMSVWDRLSLALCGGLRGPLTVPDVPTATGSVALTLAPVGGDRDRVTCNPWPFKSATATATCKGRRLSGTFADTETMRNALAVAPAVTLAFTLVPA